MLQAYKITPPATPSHLVIMLHGIGADGENLLPLASDFLDILPNAVFLAPNAPEKYIVEGFMMGEVGYQWFPLWGKSLPELIEGASKANEKLSAFIKENLQKYNLDYSKLILIGFSQGCLMAVHAGLHLPEKCLGVVGFSGAIISTDGFNSTPDICLIHGKDDDVVPFQQTIHAEKKLKAVNASVQTKLLENLGHWIDERGINFAKEFLKERI
ncbi:MAG: prolyl oligopeptidase family serine peptidase [Rickettsiales bacterium]|nr:prolyl oligopeptidase family serine peptidase [Rickettsiales bacterium]